MYIHIIMNIIAVYTHMYMYVYMYIYMDMYYNHIIYIYTHIIHTNSYMCRKAGKPQHGAFVEA